MRTVLLSQGKVAFVDDCDYEKISQYKWFAQKVGKRWYAATDLRPAGPYLLMHRFLKADDTLAEVDHRNGDGLDNRRKNLRACSIQNNRRAFKRKIANCTSRFRGVRWHKQRCRWSAQIKTNGKQFYLGLFSSEEDAARAYDAASLKHFGEFACPNFP